MARTKPRDRRSAPTSQVTSTEAQNALGEILTRVAAGEHVFLTRYGRRQAVILSARAYEELFNDDAEELEALEAAFDAQLARMQGEAQRDATDALFGASGADLAEAAARQAGSEARKAGA